MTAKIIPLRPNQPSKSIRQPAIERAAEAAAISRRTGVGAVTAAEIASKTELTAIGEQYVMPGCEKRIEKKGEQLALWD